MSMKDVLEAKKAVEITGKIASIESVQEQAPAVNTLQVKAVQDLKPGEYEELYATPFYPFGNVICKGKILKPDYRGAYFPKSEKEIAHCDYMVEQGHLIKKKFPISKIAK